MDSKVHHRTKSSVPSIESAVPLFYDNNGAIILEKEPRSHQKSKHIERRFHVIRKLIRKGDVLVQKVASADNVAIPLTKALTQLKLDQNFEKIGLRYCSEWH